MSDRERAVLPEDAVEAGQRQAAPDGARPGKAGYTADEVRERFEEVWASLDIKQEIAELGHGMNSIFKRGRSMREFTAMGAVLWKLALERSFPADEAEFFAAFLEKSKLLGKGGARRKIQERIRIYLDLCAPKKSSDFTQVAIYMSEYLCGNIEDRKSMQFKLSLTIRRFYQFIFDHLI